MLILLRSYLLFPRATTNIRRRTTGTPRTGIVHAPLLNESIIAKTLRRFLDLRDRLHLLLYVLNLSLYFHLDAQLLLLIIQLCSTSRRIVKRRLIWVR